MFCMLPEVSQSLCQFSDRLLHLIKGKALVDLDGSHIDGEVYRHKAEEGKHRVIYSDRSH